MPLKPRPSPDHSPPRGVPRWLWPPPGAAVRSVAVRERIGADGVAEYQLEGEPLERLHLRALQWLLDEHTRAELPEAGCPFEGEIVIEIARTAMASGRVGHAYALNAGPLGAPSGDAARGILWRYIDAHTA